MMRIWTGLRIGIMLVAAAASPLAAQELRPAIFGAVGVANVYRTEDRNFGTKPNVGVGLGIEWKRLGMDVSTAMSRVNLGLHRATIGLRYRW
jgi:hypothetical protein